MAPLDLPTPRKPGRPGWYVDPDHPTRERWWNGQIWTTAIAPLARSPFGVEFERSMRPATNRMAGRSRYVAFAAIVVLVVAVADGTLIGQGDPSAFAIVALGLTIALGALAGAMGTMALRLSAFSGGDGAARASIFLGGAAIALALVALAWR